jgi:predicted acyl esterase
MEAGDYTYTVPRGFAHVIPEPRGIGASEGVYTNQERIYNPKDIRDIIEWIAAQPWCNGRVGMMGPSSYSRSQLFMAASDELPPHLVAIHPDEFPNSADSYFHGIFDTLPYHIHFGRHGNDSTAPPSNRAMPPHAPRMLGLLPKDVLDKRLEEALNHPDIKYNTKWYSSLKYPMKSPETFDALLDSFHPAPVKPFVHKVKAPMYLGTPWCIRLYIMSTFEAFEVAGTPREHKKLIVYPPGFPSRPYAQYHDETVRWYDYWAKGIDNGIMDEPPIKLFVMGINKWKFENEWPLARTRWTKFYLHPEGKLSTKAESGTPPPDSFTQPAPYLDPTVYCLKYETAPLDEDMEVTGPIACHLDAAIDIDDTNWMVDLVDVAADGSRQLLSTGHLKAKFRALDEKKTKPYQPIHPRQEPVPVVPGEINHYAIQMMPTANVFRKGHSVELIIRNQDDVLSRLGTWGVYMLPFMQTVTHTIHFGSSHVLLPLIPKAKR